MVAYRVSALTAFLVRATGLVKVRYFSQPNLLAGRRLVPELLQEQVTGPALAEALLSELEDPQHVAELVSEFTAIHRTLRCGAAARAAEAILACLPGAPSGSGEQHVAPR